MAHGLSDQRGISPDRVGHLLSNKKRIVFMKTKKISLIVSGLFIASTSIGVAIDQIGMDRATASAVDRYGPRTEIFHKEGIASSISSVSDTTLEKASKPFKNPLTEEGVDDVKKIVNNGRTLIVGRSSRGLYCFGLLLSGSDDTTASSCFSMQQVKDGNAAIEFNGTLAGIVPDNVDSVIVESVDGVQVPSSVRANSYVVKLGMNDAFRALEFRQRGVKLLRFNSGR